MGGCRWQQAEAAEPGGAFLPLYPVAQRCFQVALSHTEDVVSRKAEALKIIPSVALSVHSHRLGACRVITVNGGS